LKKIGLVGKKTGHQIKAVVFPQPLRPGPYTLLQGHGKIVDRLEAPKERGAPDLKRLTRKVPPSTGLLDRIAPQTVKAERSRLIPDRLRCRYSGSALGLNHMTR
jgi:hypothetical protein